MDYTKKIETIRKYMEENEVEAYITTADANMEYLTGIPRLGGGNTRERQHSIEYSCLVITNEDIIVFLPNLKKLIAEAKLKDKEYIGRIVAYPDGDTKGEALVYEFKRLGLINKTIGISQDISGSLVLLLQNALGIKIKDLNQILFDLRSVKSEREIELIKKAVEITDNIYDELVNIIRPGVSLFELEHLVDELIVRFGGSQNSFQGDLNLHGKEAGHFVGYSHHTIEKGYVLGMDIGAMYGGYCSDFGRTIFIGEPTKEQIKIYETVKHSHFQAVNQMTPQSTGAKTDKIARDIIENAGYGDRFIHKLGHSIGMDVHERPFLAKGENENLKNNMIFAVEPSIYTPRDSFIRIEDEVIVGANGGKIMSRIGHEIKVID